MPDTNIIRNYDHPSPGPRGGVMVPNIQDTDTMESPAYRQGREALRISREVRPGLKETE